MRLAEVLAALVEKAQQEDPDSLTIEVIAERANVHRVTLTNIVTAAKKGRPRAVDEETFWNVCKAVGLDSEAVVAPELRAMVAAWRAAQSVAPADGRRGAKKRKGQTS